MMISHLNTSRHACRGLVIALHCSGAGAAQWRPLAAALGTTYELSAPEHYGSASAGPWTGEQPFTLAVEAARTIALIDRASHPVHLIGHSYGGGVALHAAIARRNRIASLSLYEPSAFHLLVGMGEKATHALAEITAVARDCAVGTITGDYRRAAANFVDYWNGPGAWDALRPDIRDCLTRWLPKATLDFHALFGEPTPLAAYGDLPFPVLAMRGEHAPAPTRLIAEALAGVLADGRLVTIAGAGHMGPLTHAEPVNAEIVAHIRTADAAQYDTHRTAAA
jgi:pimeloyl-ACP methyl ester carboxylesterase